jgi:hybrid cluster-associated redox disulfide protein
MDRYTKGFVVASLAYFFLASVLGIWMGGADAAGWVRFAHVHFNLLGFMSMMIYGVGYFILPRFNGRTLHWPSWVPIHFFIANIGLIGMVATAPERPSTGFILFSALSVISAGMFAVNLGATMLMEPGKEEESSTAEETASPAGVSSAPEDTPAGPAPAPPPPAAPRIDPDMRVGEVLTRWPQTVDVFVGHGFASLASPEHREQVKQIPITLRMACQRHNVDLDYMVSELNEAISPSSVAKETSAASEGKPAARKAAKGKLSKGETIGTDHILGEILAAYPETEKVFRKYYGDGCFSCPGQATESVKQSAMMHNVNERQLLAELNRAAGF